MTRARRLPLSRRRGTKASPQKLAPRRLFVEALEDRRVMAAITGVVNGGTLELTGDAAANTLAVSVAAGTLNLTAAAGTIDLTALGLGDVAAQAVDLAAEGITKVKIDLAGDGDTVNFGAVAANPALTEIFVADTGAAGTDAVNVNGVVSVGGDFIITGVEATLLASNVTTTGGQTYNGPVTVGANVVLASTGSGNIAFASTVIGPFALAINTAGTTTFLGGVNLASLTTDAPGSTVLNANILVAVSTTGAQTYNDPVTLAINTTLASTAGGDITFASTVNGAHDLFVDTAGATVFGGAVGGTTPLTRLRTLSPGTVAINGGGVTTVGKQDYAEPLMTLGANTTFKSTGSEIINMALAVNGPFALTFDTAGSVGLGTVGNLTPLTSVTTLAGANLEIFGTGVTTTGAQSYNDHVFIGTNVVFTSTGAGNITFSNSIAGLSDLTVNTAGTTTLSGGANRVTTDAAGTTVIHGSMITTAGQTYNDPVTLDIDTVVESTGGGNITFASTIDGAFGLTVNTTGTTTLGGALGFTTPLASVTTNAGGTTALNGVILRTNGDQTYNDPVTLGNTAIFGTFNPGNITFASTVDGNRELVNNSEGTTTFRGAVGGTVPLDQLFTNSFGTTRIEGGSVTTTRMQSYQGPTVVSNAATHVTTLTAGSGTPTPIGVTLQGSLNGAVAGESVTINSTGSVNFNGPTGNIQPLNNLTVTSTQNDITVSAGVTVTGNIQFTANETAAVDTNSIVVNAAATVASTGGSVTLQAGDNITLLGTVTAAAGVINITSIDAADTPAAGVAGATGTVFTLTGTLSATQINVTGSAANDVFNMAFARVTGPVVVRGGANDATLAPEVIRDTAAADVPAITKFSKSPFFLPTIKSFVRGDQLLIDDNGATPADNLNRDYTIDGIQIRRVGDAASFVTFPDHDLELLKLTTGRGNNDITANMAANGALPTIVQVDTAGSQSSPADDRFQVLGTAGGDNISIGDIDLHSSLSSGPLGPIRAHFELKGVQRQWVQSFAGDDVIDNISSVPGLLDGGAGKDAINSIVNHSSSFKLAKKIENSVPKNVTLVLGNEDADKLYVGAGFIDKGVAVTPLITALKNFPDLGITFLIGDHSVVANKLTEVALAKQKGDNYASSASAFQHGFIALKDFSDPAPAPNTSLGSFRFGAGDKVKFSKTIAWLKAQLFVGAAVPLLLKSLNTQVAEYTRPVTDAAGEGSLLDLADGESSSMPVLDARIDVNRDGHISPADALLIINDLNASGSRRLPTLEIGEGEDSAGEELTPILDVNVDSHLTPLDALLVINVLNILGKPDDVSAAAADDFMEENAEEDLAAPATAINSPSTAAASPEAIFSLLASDCLAAERRRQEAAAALI